jgi:predicted ATP-grasp superfamily ATP-dependent carboligase
VRVFVSEYICGGSCSEDPRDSSLAREGRSMLLAACADFARISGCEVHTTWDGRLGAFPLETINAHVVRGAREECMSFDALAAQCDFTFMIAPEFGGWPVARAVMRSGKTVRRQAATWRSSADARTADFGG